jgi:hypothetical protein
MNKLDTEMFLNGRVVGYQYQLRIVITYGETENVGEMIVFDAFGIPVDKFKREFHHQYHREFIKKSMRDTASVRDEVPELKEQK